MTMYGWKQSVLIGLVAMMGSAAIAVAQSGAAFVPTVSNFAGAGNLCTAATNTSGDGCLATQAIVNSPHIGSFDGLGNFYFTDSNTAANAGRIRRVDVRTGIITTVAGGATTVCAAATDVVGDGCPATQATLNVPYSVKLDAAGNLYLADGKNHRVRFVSAATGIITTIVGTGVASTAAFANGTAAGSIALDQPYDIALDKASNLYISQASAYYLVLVVANGGTVKASSAAYILAGTGTAGFGGDNGASPSGQINSSRGITVDASGNVYLADYSNNRVRKLTTPFASGTLNLAASTISTYAGTGATGTTGDGGAATLAHVNSPESVVVDPAGNLYIDCVSSGSAYIREVFASSGNIQSIAGTGLYGNTGDGLPAAKATFNGEIGVALDPYGNLYVTDTGNNRVRKISLGTSFPATAVGGASIMQSYDVGFTQAVTPQSYGVAGGYADFTATTLAGCALGTSSAAGTFCQNAAAFQPVLPGLRTAPLGFSDGGINKLMLGLSGVGTAPSLSFSPATLRTIAGTGTSGNSTGGGVALSALLNSPRGGAADSAGHVYFADAGNNQVEQVTLATGAIVIVAGTGVSGYSGDGGAATSAQLNAPANVVVDAGGNLYIADTGNNRIRVVSALTGTISTLAGTGTAGFSGDGGLASASQLSAPAGLALDTLGNLYIADTGNHVVRRVALGSNLISTYAGTASNNGYSGDGMVATVAKLNTPMTVAVDAVGDVYIADTGNNVVREVLAGGTMTTFAGVQGTTVNTGDGGLATNAGLQSPTDVAVDASGDVFVVAGSVVRHVDASGIVTTVAGNGVSGSYAGEGGASTSATLGTSIGNVFVDGQGTVYIAATAAHRLLAISTGTAPTLAFGSQTLGGQSSAQTLTLTNNGNAPLTLTQLSVSNNYVLQASASSSCTSSTTLPAGGACTVTVAFAPTTGLGSLNGSINLADNALNVTSTQNVALTGTGTVNSTGFKVTGLASTQIAGASAAVTVTSASGTLVNTGYVGTVHFTSTDLQAALPADYTFTVSDAGVHTFSNVTLKTAGTQSVTLTDTAQATINGLASTTVTAAALSSISVSGISIESATVGTGFASPISVQLADAYGNAVAGTQVSFLAPASGASANFAGATNAVTVTSNANGVATTPLLTANAASGSYGVVASAQTLSQTATFSLTNLVARSAVQVALAASNASPVVGKSVTLTATVSSTATGVPTQNVVFSDGATQLASVALNGSGVATYYTSSLALGKHTITVSYQGDTNFLPNTSAGVTVTVVAQPDFMLTATPTTQTLHAGQTATYVLTLTPVNSYAGSATLSCGQLPSNVVCGFKPPALQSFGVTAVQGILSVSSAAYTSNDRVPARSGPATWMAGGLLLVAWFAQRRLRTLRSLALMLSMLVGSLWISGCGSGLTAASTGMTQIVVTANDATQGISHTINLTLTLQ